MKIFTYQRKAQFTDQIENWVGIKNETYSVYVDVYNPISFNTDGTYSIMSGICHTNAENVIELTKQQF